MIDTTRCGEASLFESIRNTHPAVVRYTRLYESSDHNAFFEESVKQKAASFMLDHRSLSRRYIYRERMKRRLLLLKHYSKHHPNLTEYWETYISAVWFRFQEFLIAVMRNIGLLIKFLINGLFPERNKSSIVEEIRIQVKFLTFAF